ncbi:FkbM family methyltransferase [Microcystis aeruginosa]|uniref:Uncharacterized protein n=1 Tax=Microcystis aeruginosa 11-30S32 TaxID=2358142 RepID=A0A510PIV5_MICAE|nr:FkbM family methyltransferase [Microcystis aeruginosa]GCA93734.1 hypothetical protein CVU71_10870 [Microcystis aeruginosa 11-30S32]
MLVNPKLCQELNHILRENHFLIEDLIEKIYSSFTKIGDICVDGGANIGRHTIPLAKLVGESGKVFAIEPIPSNSEILLARLSRHHLSNTIFYQNALSDVDDKQCNFYHVLNLPQEGGLRKKTDYSQAPQFKEIKTTTKTLDTILEKESNIRFIKLDLEGGEFHCLRGSLNTLIQNYPFIIFESARETTAKDYNYTREDFFTFFEQIDYVLYDLLGQELNRNSWLDSQLFFYFIAVKRNSKDHLFLKSQLPDLLQQALNSFQTNHFIIDRNIQINPGTFIDFTNSADTVFFHQLDSQGFSGSEPLGSWTQSPHVFLNFYSDYRDYFLLKFTIRTVFLTAQKHDSIDVKVSLDQKIIDIWKFEYNFFSEKLDKYIVICPEFLKKNKGRINLELKIDSPASPKSLDVSSDSRQLGLLISSISCHDVNMSECISHSSPVTNSPSPTVETAPTEKSAASSPYSVDFSKDTANVSLEGFSFPEDWGRWTDGSPASIKFVQNLPSSFELIFKAAAFGPNVNKDIIISVGSQQQKIQLTDKAAEIKVKFTGVPANERTITFTIPEPTSPKQLGEKDERKLGIAFNTLNIVETK